MSKTAQKKVPRENTRSFADFLFSFGCFIKQYTEWTDQADNLLCEILKTQQYKEILKRSYTLNDYQVLLSVFEELSRKRKNDFGDKCNEYNNLKKKLQREHHEAKKMAIKDLDIELKDKKKVLRKEVGFFEANKLYKEMRKNSNSDFENYWNERVAYWEKFKIVDLIELRMNQIRREMRECLMFYEYIFKKIAKINTQKQNILFLEKQKSDFLLGVPELPN